MTHYEILGIRKTASNEEIKDAYKKLVKKFHPDVYAGDKTFAEKKIKEINEAYDILSNPDLKKEYDEKINPQNTGYSPNSYSSYTYSSPNYNSSYYSHKTTTSKRNAQARGSKYSYENYKRTYNSSNTYNSNNYGSYDYQKRYTDYHRSKTPNSNYTQNDASSQYTEKIINTIFNPSKIGILVAIVFLFIIFLTVNIFQISSFFANPSYKLSSSTSTSVKKGNTSSYRNTTKNNPYTSKNNSQNKNSYLNEAKPSTSNTNRNDVNSLEDFDINDYFSDSEIMEAYTAYGFESYGSFEEFKEALKKAFYEAYIFNYK